VIGNQLKLEFASSIGYNEAEINLNIKLALKKGLEDGVFRMAKVAGKGSGSYKLTETELRKFKKKLTTSNSNTTATNNTKQQTGLKNFITKTPKLIKVDEKAKEEVQSPKIKQSKEDKSGAKKSSVKDVRTPEAYVILKDVLSPTFKKAEDDISDDSEDDAKTPESYVLLENVMDSLRRNSCQRMKDSPEPITDSSSSPSLRKKVKKGH